MASHGFPRRSYRGNPRGKEFRKHFLSDLNLVQPQERQSQSSVSLAEEISCPFAGAAAATTAQFVKKNPHMIVVNDKEYNTQIHVEAYFIGSVIHSIDHAMMERSLPDPHVLQSERFSWMAEMGRFVRAGFTEDPPFGLPCAFADSPVPFHQKVFEKACAVNLDLAKEMQTCICR